MKIRFSFLLPLAALVVLGQGCIPEPFQKLAEPEIQGQAIKSVTCETIEETRITIHQEFSEQMEAISDAYWEEYRGFEQELQQCLSNLWQGGPCDDEWAELRASYSAVSQDVSNDTLYNDYKAKKAAWDACYANWDQEYENYEADETKKQEKCQEEFQGKISRAQEARQAEERKAEQKRAADLAALAEFERQCRKSASEGGAGIQGGGEIVVVGGDGSEQVIPTPGPIQASNDACTGGSRVGGTAIPGENSTPRTGKVAENPAQDVLVEILQQTAESVTGSPVPTNAINDKIFAGMICVKLYGRIIEIQQAASDAEWGNDRREQIRLRRELARYRRARNVWCAIAEGRPPTNLQAEVVALQDEAVCESDSDCGPPVCCSNTEIGTWSCTEDGDCVSKKEACPAQHICSGRPAECVFNPPRIKAIPYSGTYIPLDQVYRFTGPECEGDEHWHANTGSVTAVNGEVFIDPNPNECGFGKTREVKEVEIVVVGNE